MRPLCRPLALLLLVLPSCALAQAGSKVFFTNIGPYTEAELLKVTGIAPGQAITDDAISQGAQRLADTGLFDDAAATYNGQGAQRQVRYTLKPTPASALLPVSFANVVWYTPQELDVELRKRVPLYRGRISEAGNMADSISAALVSMLLARGAIATIEHEAIAPSLLHPQRVISFHVTRPSVRLAAVKLTGDPTGVPPPDSMRPVINESYQVLASLAGQPYIEGRCGETFEDKVLAPLRDAGYILVRIDDFQRTATPALQGVEVTVTGKLNVGSKYKVSAITWSATPLYSNADFAAAAKLHAGDTAADDKLLATEAPILKAYRTRGYMDAVIESGLATDDIAHTVSYTLHATPGEVYHLQSLSVVGLPPEVQAEFDAAWTMKAGDVYNEPYINKFIQNNTAMRKLSAYAGAYQASADPEKHTVDLTLTFTRFR